MERIYLPYNSIAVASVLELLVASATNPTELNAIGTTVPDWRLAHTSVVGADDATLYRLEASTATVNPPYVMASATAGKQWIAIAGHYHNPAIATASTMTVSSLTATRIPFAGTAGLLSDEANLTWDSSGKIVTIGSAAAINPGLILASNSGQTRFVDYYTGALQRWRMRATATAEAGSSAGSDWALTAYDDAGVQIDNVLVATRAALGALAIARPTTITAASNTNDVGALTMAISSVGLVAGLQGIRCILTPNPAAASSTIYEGARTACEPAGAQNYTSAFRGIRGINGRVRHAGTGTVTQATSIVADMGITAAGVITTAEGLGIPSPAISGGGSITTFAAIAIDALSGATNNYAFKSAGAGLVSIGDTTSASSAIAGALTVGNGTAATSVAIGGGKLNVGGTLAAAGVSTFSNATAATTSLLGAVVIGNGVAATSVGIGGGAINMGSSLTVGGSVTGTMSYTDPAGNTNPVIVTPTVTITANNANSAFNRFNMIAAGTNFNFTGTTGIRGVQGHGQSSVNGTGVVTAILGAAGSVNNSGTGTVTNGYALYAFNASNTGGGTFQNAYGLYVEAMTNGSVSNYAIYTGSGLVRLGDTTGSTSSTTGAVLASGGIAATGRIYTGTGLGVHTAAAASMNVLDINVAGTARSFLYAYYDGSNTNYRQYCGHGGASVPYWEIYNIANTLSFVKVFNNTGNVVLGNSATPADDAVNKLQVVGSAVLTGKTTALQLAQTGALTTGLNAIKSDATYTATGSQIANEFEINGGPAGAMGAFDQYTAVRAYASCSGTIAVPYMCAIQPRVNINTTGNTTWSYGAAIFQANVNTGTVADMAHVYVQSPSNSGGGAITRQYGLYCETLTAAGTNYAIYTAGVGQVKISDTTVSSSGSTGAVVLSGSLAITTTGGTTAASSPRAFDIETNTGGAATAYTRVYGGFLQANLGTTDTVSDTSIGLCGIEARARTNGTATAGVMQALRGNTYITGSGAIPAAYGVYASINPFGTGTSTVSTAYGIYSDLQLTNTTTLTVPTAVGLGISITGGTVTSAIGISIASVTTGSSSNAAIQTGLGKIVFGDTTVATSSINGALILGNLTAATTVAMGGGKIFCGDSLTAGASSSIIKSAAAAVLSLTIQNTGAGAGTSSALYLDDATSHLFQILPDNNGTLCSIKAINRNTEMDFWTGTGVGAQRLKIDPTGLGTFKSTVDASAIATASWVYSGGVAVTKTLIVGQNTINGVASTATAAATTTLTVASARTQIFTGVTTQTIQLPAANAAGAGIAIEYVIINRSTGTVTPTRAGADTFVGGATTDPVLTLAQQKYTSDGVSVWYKI